MSSLSTGYSYHNSKMAGFDVFIGLPNLEWKRQLRENDMEYRKIINERRIVDDARRKVDEKTEQLKAIAEISTIIAGIKAP